MSALLWVPAALLVLGATAVWLAAKASHRADRLVGRLARALVGDRVTASPERKQRIEAAYIGESYAVYASKTYLYAVLALAAGVGAGVLLVTGVLAVAEPLVRLLSGLPNTIAVPLGFTHDYRLVMDGATRSLLAAIGGAVVGPLLAAVAYAARWQLPASDAEVRRRSIDEGLPRTTAFLFALTRGGMSFPAAIRILGENEAVFGETAREMRVAVREMDVFGRDVIAAVRRTSRRTPSDQFKTFSENLASVLQSGSDLSAFLREQYDRFQERAEDRQAEIVELLATIAEGYVTVLVAGMLFFITILLVFGLTTTDTLWALQLVAYLIIPLANAAFVVYLAGKLDALGIARGTGGDVLDRIETSTPIRESPPADTRRADGGTGGQPGAGGGSGTGETVTGDPGTRGSAAGETVSATSVAASHRTQLAAYDRLRRVRRATRNPVRTVARKPTTVLYAVVPLALVMFAVRFPTATQGTTISVRVLDDLVVQSVLVVLVPYAVARETYKRRIDRIEAATPELLERLASLNEAGMTLTEGLERVRGGDLGVLGPEVDRMWRDVEYGATVEDAFVRFGRRVRTTAVTRVVTLVTHAHRASGKLSDVLRIASTQARADLKMRERRRRQMLTYLVVIYVAFLVFLVIIFAVNEVLIPSLPDSVPTPSNDVNPLGANVDQFARLGSVDKAAYALVFFHTALVQAVCSGFIGGQLGEGTLRDGVKHAAAMLGVAYVVFVLLSSPVASIGFSSTVSVGDTVNVPSASASDGGFVVAYDDGVNSTKLGQSRYLPPGTHEDVLVSLDRPIRENRTITLVVHRDTDGDGALAFGGPYLPGVAQTDGPYPPIANRGTPGADVEVTYVGD